MLYAPHKKQAAIHRSDARFKVLCWGRRVGKSTLAGNYTLLKGMHKYQQMIKDGKTIREPLRYFIVAPTYRQAKSIFWNDILKTQIPREIVLQYNEAELTVSIPHFDVEMDGEEFKSKIHPNAEGLPAIVIELKGAENEDSLRGVKLSGVVLDEYAFMKPLVWEQILRPALADEKGWAVFISTPNGFNHFYNLYEFAKNRKGWFRSYATIYDNPYIDREEIEEIKQSEFARDPDGNTWHQEYMADFRQMKGLVFKQFNRKKHLIPPDRIPMEGTNLIGVDFGYEAPFAAVFARIDFDQNWYIYDLLYQAHMTTDEAIANLRTKMTGQRFAAIVGDSAQAQEIANFKQRNFPIRATTTKGGRIDKTNTGVRMIADKLKPTLQADGKLRPKLFVADIPETKPLVEEFEHYSYAEPKEGMTARDVPIDDWNHALDALRYIMLAHVEYRTPYVRKQRVWDKITGRALT